MGCTTSRIDETELVLRCKNRKRLMKQVVGYRQEFAIAHIAYIQALKSFGIALHQFAEGDCNDVHPSPGSPATPILSLPPPSSSPTAALPPPVIAPALSPPFSPSSPSLSPISAAGTTAVPVASNPSSSPSSASPPTVSPLPGAAAQPLPELSPPRDEMSSVSIAPLHSENGFVSSESSPMGSPVFSPGREEHEDYFRSFQPPPPSSLNPPPPPSPPRDSSWDIFGFFHPPPIPFHLQEQRRMKQIEEEEEVQDLEHVREEEGIPDLEEEELNNDGKEDERDEGQDQEKPVENISEETVEVNLEKKGPDFGTEKLSEKVEDPMEEEAVVAIVDETDLEAERKENEEDGKELVILTTFREKNIIEVTRHVEDQFIRAYASGRDVAGMLETTKVHHHKVFLELKDSVRVFNAITWHWSNKIPLALKDTGEDSDVAECGMTGSHSSTLERLYAWERKLYDEVKAGEIIRMAFDRKCEQLKVQDAKGEDPNAIDKTRAAVKDLDTQLIVALRAIHSVSLRIQKLTNEELYPQLIEILGGLMSMWKVMLECHHTQAEIALEMKSLENSIAGEAMTEAHRKATINLENELNSWQIHFSRWISSQEYYIDTLLAWLRLCRMEPETDNKGRIVSPYWGGGPPVFSLIKNWHHALKNLREREEVVDVVFNFSTVLHSLQLEQLEELRQKRRAEVLAKDLDRRTLSLQTLEKKFVESQPDSDEKQETTASGALQERRVVLSNIRSRVLEEKQKLVDTVHIRQENTLASFKANLPSIFEAMASFAGVALKEYERLLQIPEIRKIQHF